MKTIIENTKSEIEINKSRFISLIYRVKNIDDVKEKLEQAKKIYRDASHYCYAYIINDLKKSSDDGEPGGTAGVPIMEVLLKNELNYVLCIVIRYFGGIKLGAGGLVRAYSKSVVSSLKKENIVNLIPGYEVVFNINYEQQSKIDHLLKDFKVEKEYLDTIKYDVLIPIEKISLLNNIEYQIIKETEIEKK